MPKLVNNKADNWNLFRMLAFFSEGENVMYPEKSIGGKKTQRILHTAKLLFIPTLRKGNIKNCKIAGEFSHFKLLLLQLTFHKPTIHTA